MARPNSSFVLANGPMDAGVHERSWDGRDLSGKRVAGGVCFLELPQAECRHDHQ